MLATHTQLMPKDLDQYDWHSCGGCLLARPVLSRDAKEIQNEFTIISLDLIPSALSLQF